MMAVARYTLEGTGSGPEIAFLLGVGYAAALVAPFARLTNIKRKMFFTVLPAATSLAYASVSSARLGFLIAASLTAGGIIAAAITATGKAPVVRLKVLIVTLVASLLIAGAFIGIGALRIGEASAESVRLSFEKQVIYAVGSAGAFATWYGDYGSGMGQKLGYGTATVAGMEHLTGQQRSETRAFDEFSVIDTSGRKSNVYTIFRGLLLDFGVAGTFIVLAVSGFIFGRLGRRASFGRPVAATFVGYGYATIFLSGWMATTTFTNVLAVAVAAPLVISVARRRAVSRDRVAQQRSLSGRGVSGRPVSNLPR
jgi:oligosaccharide repeat unit polymerase